METPKDTAEMLAYWMKYTKDLSLNTMFCDDQGEMLANLDTAEILTLIPDVANLDVLELGAGIGRFTGVLASRAKSVIAVDFIEKFIATNKQTNEHYGNVTFMCADATKLDIPENSVDVIFTSWLFEYVNNDLLLPTITKYLRFLREGGCFFLRESCFHPSGTIPRPENPTIYRKPLEYSGVLQSVSVPGGSGEGEFGFEIVFSRSVQSYVQLRQNFNNICWLVRKVRLTRETSGEIQETTQRYLDIHQYSLRNISKYRCLHANSLVSVDDVSTAKNLYAKLALAHPCNVLEVGSGLGDNALHLSEAFGATVTAVDLSCNMTGLALEKRLKQANKKVQFEVGDIMQRKFPEASFDVILCKDVALHIADKEQLFDKFHKWLKPNGKLIISDYCATDKAPAPTNLAEYVARNHYSLSTSTAYSELMKKAGFTSVQVEDETKQLTEILRSELTRFPSKKADFTAAFSDREYDELCQEWERKIQLCESQELHWVIFRATK